MDRTRWDALVIRLRWWRRRLRWPVRRLAGGMPARRWAILIGAVVTAVVIAVGVRGAHHHTAADPRLRALGARMAAELRLVPVRAARLHRDDYQRDAFGPAWTDAAGVAGAGNGCDTRNDVLRRDLRDVSTGAVSSCPAAVLSGEFRSPYTGKFLVFRRDRGAAAVQIDHIVPLAYAWDMGAADWPAARRVDLGNDPANLVAVDAASNQAKSDAEPARWMPPERGFWCQYAIQFVLVIRAYGLSVDAASAQVLAEALRC